MPVVLIIDDDRSVRILVEHAFEGTEVALISVATAEAGLEAIQTHRPDVVLLDIVLPNTSGLDLYQQIATIDHKLPIIFVTVGGTSDNAITAMMLGAYDYLLKPLDVRILRETVNKAFESRRLMHVPVAMPANGTTHPVGDQLVGRSPLMLDVYKAVARVAPQDVTVLIRGETGTGKELVARAIYQHSQRKDGPFLAVNCAAMTETLLESELFGHEKGAFTGADKKRIGKFEQCHGGTIFLDEVGDMSQLVQSKVLRLLQEQSFERVGGNTTIETDVRIISATHRDLDAMGEEGKFRTDLFYRLNGFSIELPPLRQRGGDIRLLLEHFLTRFRIDLKKNDVDGIADDAVSLLMSYTWPGNVREMQSVIRQALLNVTGSVIVAENLPAEIRGGHRHLVHGTEEIGLPDSDLRAFIDQQLEVGSKNLYAEALEMMERYLISRVLRQSGGNQSQTAETLGITRGKVRDRIASFGITFDKTVSVEQTEL